MIYKDKYTSLELIRFLAEIDSAILHPKLDVELMLREIAYLKTEFDKLRSTEPTSLSKEEIFEIENVVVNEMNEWRMPIWFNYIASGLSVSETRIKKVFDYYFDKEDYEKCDVINKAKEGNFDYILKKTKK